MQRTARCQAGSRSPPAGTYSDTFLGHSYPVQPHLPLLLWPHRLQRGWCRPASTTKLSHLQLCSRSSKVGATNTLHPPALPHRAPLLQLGGKKASHPGKEPRKRRACGGAARAQTDLADRDTDPTVNAVPTALGLEPGTWSADGQFTAKHSPT